MTRVRPVFATLQVIEGPSGAEIRDAIKNDNTLLLGGIGVRGIFHGESKQHAAERNYRPQFVDGFFTRSSFLKASVNASTMTSGTGHAVAKSLGAIVDRPGHLGGPIVIDTDPRAETVNSIASAADFDDEQSAEFAGNLHEATFIAVGTTVERLMDRSSTARMFSELHIHEAQTGYGFPSVRILDAEVVPVAEPGNIVDILQAMNSTTSA